MTRPRLLQLQRHQARLVGLEIVQGCCVVADASNMSNPVLARTEMGTSPECYSNASEAQDPQATSATSRVGAQTTSSKTFSRA